jgi:hypothetical protein
MNRKTLAPLPAHHSQRKLWHHSHGAENSGTTPGPLPGAPLPGEYRTLAPLPGRKTLAPLPRRFHRIAEAVAACHRGRHWHPPSKRVQESSHQVTGTNFGPRVFPSSHWHQLRLALAAPSEQNTGTAQAGTSSMAQPSRLPVHPPENSGTTPASFPCRAPHIQ